jgi:MFS family permease
VDACSRFGNAAVLRVSTLVSAAGIATIVFIDNPVLAGSGVVLWGLGAALGFPVTISAAGDSDNPTSSVAAVTTAGSMSPFSSGHPCSGFWVKAFGLRAAMILVLVIVALSSLFTSAANPRFAPHRSGLE